MHKKTVKTCYHWESYTCIHNDGDLYYHYMRTKTHTVTMSYITGKDTFSNITHCHCMGIFPHCTNVIQMVFVAGGGGGGRLQTVFATTQIYLCRDGSQWKLSKCDANPPEAADTIRRMKMDFSILSWGACPEAHVTYLRHTAGTTSVRCHTKTKYLHFDVTIDQNRLRF